MIRIVWYTALVLATLAILSLLWQFNAVVVLFLISLAFEAAIHSLIDEFQKRGIHRRLAIAISYAIVVAVVGALFLLASGPLVANLQQATDDISINYEQIKNHWLQGNNPLLNNLAAQMPPSQALYKAITGDKASVALQTLFGAAEGTFSFLTQLLMVVVLSMYWSLGHVRFERFWLSLLPVEARFRARSIWLSFQSGIGAFLRREAMLSLLTGVLFWVGYMLLGIKYAVLLALIGGLARLIPWLGSLLAIFLPLLAGSTLGGWASLVAALYSLLMVILLEFGLGNTVFPRQKYSSLLLVLFLITMTDAYGLPGAIFSPVLAATLQILLDNLLIERLSRSPEVPAQTLVNLQLEMEKIRDRAEAMEPSQSAEAASLIVRLEGLLEKTNALLRQE